MQQEAEKVKQDNQRLAQEREAMMKTMTALQQDQQRIAKEKTDLGTLERIYDVRYYDICVLTLRSGKNRDRYSHMLYILSGFLLILGLIEDGRLSFQYFSFLLEAQAVEMKKHKREKSDKSEKRGSSRDPKKEEKEKKAPLPVSVSSKSLPPPSSTSSAPLPVERLDEDARAFLTVIIKSIAGTSLSLLIMVSYLLLLLLSSFLMVVL